MLTLISISIIVSMYFLFYTSIEVIAKIRANQPYRKEQIKASLLATYIFSTFIIFIITCIPL
ncbi:MAG: hypothetical protein RR840_05835 [Clostridium sp.]